MDTLTQVALGVATSEAVFRRRLGRPANWLAASSALLPDLDFLCPLDGEWSFITIHRGFSHSLPFCLAASFPLAWLFHRACKGEKSYWLLWACSAAALLSHPLLDLCTSYGTRTLVPFSDRRFAWDFIGIIDLVYTGVLLAALAGCVIARRRGRPGWGPRIAAAGLCLSTAYVGLGAVNHARAVRITREAAEGMGVRPVRVEAFPMVGTVAVWRLIAETEDGFLVGKMNFLRLRPPRLSLVEKAKGGLVSKAIRHPRVTQFREFTRGLFRPVMVDESTVEFDDMRYGFPADSPRSLWSARVVFDGGEIGQVSVVRRHFRALSEKALHQP